MDKVPCSERIKEVMRERNLRQVDVLNLAQPYCEQYHTTISKSLLSLYLSGYTEPGNTKLAILARALGVSPAWLMGLDAPKKTVRNEIEELMSSEGLSPEYNSLIQLIEANRQNSDFISKLLDQAQLLDLIYGK